MADLKFFITTLCLFGTLTLAGMANGFVASSSHYLLQSDSLNFGGSYSSSSSYQLEDTLGEIGTGRIASTTAILNGGYQAMSADTYIAVSALTTVTLTPALSGVGGGIANASTSLVSQTDNPAGYELTIAAATTPALTSGSNSLADYTPSYTEPDYAWNTPVGESRFGFSPEGSGLTSSFHDDGVSCGSGSSDTTDRCWAGLSTTAQTIVRIETPNAPTGATTTLKFRAEIGSQKAQASGNYQASIIVTAITL